MPLNPVLVPTVVDREDGTGADLSLAGNAGTAEVYISNFQGYEERQFLKAGEIVGNGSLAINVANGAFLLHVVNDLDDVAMPLVFRVSDGSDRVHWACLWAVRSYVLSLALPGVPDDPYYHIVAKKPYQPGTEFRSEPGVYYFPAAETIRVEDNRRDGISYPVQVIWLRKSGHDMVDGLEDILAARELMNRSFSGTPLPSLPCIHTMIPVPGPPIMGDQWRLNFDASSVMFRCITQVLTGVT